MLEILKKELNISIITSIVYIILGVIIVSNPETTISVVGTIIAILAIIYGIIVSIINMAKIKEENSFFTPFSFYTILKLVLYLSYSFLLIQFQLNQLQNILSS